MKKRTVLLAIALVFACLSLKAQIGVEDPVLKDNVFIGFKGGLNAMDMAYQKGSISFVNQSVLIDNPMNLLRNPKSILSCGVAGITVERSLPGFSYGLECFLSGLNAKSKYTGNEQPVYVKQDSAFFVNLNKSKSNSSFRVHPVVFVAPNFSTYLYLPVKEGLVINGYSIWNGEGIVWGTKNINFLQVSVVGGLGAEGDIDIRNYLIRVRLEAGYNYGLLNMAPKDLGMTRNMRGFEATLGVSFPLFTNPHYMWLN